MGINLVIAVTDGDWFEMLRQQPNLGEVNFWSPSAANFRALRPGELFLFKLHAPQNMIVGGGIFTYANLPALDAAHIRPYGEGGTHEAQNGLLLRRDIHSLFDAGYVTVTPNLNFEVSRRIKEKFQNGRHYRALHGQRISTPHDASQRPDPDALTWHNEHCFRG